MQRAQKISFIFFSSIFFLLRKDSAGILLLHRRRRRRRCGWWLPTREFISFIDWATKGAGYERQQRRCTTPKIKSAHTAHTHREEIERIYSTTKEGEICVCCCCCCCCYTGNHLRLLETRSLLLTRSLVKIKKGRKKNSPVSPAFAGRSAIPHRAAIYTVHYVMIRLHPLTGIHSLLRNPILTEPLSFPPCDPSLFLLGTHAHTHPANQPARQHIKSFKDPADGRIDRETSLCVTSQ